MSKKRILSTTGVILLNLLPFLLICFFNNFDLPYALYELTIALPILYPIGIAIINYFYFKKWFQVLILCIVNVIAMPISFFLPNYLKYNAISNDSIGIIISTLYLLFMCSINISTALLLTTFKFIKNLTDDSKTLSQNKFAILTRQFLLVFLNLLPMILIFMFQPYYEYTVTVLMPFQLGIMLINCFVLNKIKKSILFNTILILSGIIPIAVFFISKDPLLYLPYNYDFLALISEIVILVICTFSSILILSLKSKPKKPHQIN